MPMKDIEKNYRRAVREAIAETHAAGLPVHQIRRGRLVAMYPDGSTKVLKVVDPSFAVEEATHGKTANVVARRA